MSTTKTLKPILEPASLHALGRLPYGLKVLPYSLMATALWLALAASVQAQDPIRLQHRWELEPDTGALWNAELAEGEVRVDLGRLTSGVAEYRLNEARRIIQNVPRLVESDRLLARNTILQQLRTGKIIHCFARPRLRPGASCLTPVRRRKYGIWYSRNPPTG